VAELIDIVLNVDSYLAGIVQAYGPWVYALLFAVVFAETGLIVTPFLPGDSLLFAAGALAASDVGLNPVLTASLLFAAAVAGDAVNYSVGRYAGPKVFHAHDQANLIHRLLNRDHLAKAHAFFEKHGGKAIVLGRFVPIVRTFVPFVAGAAEMTRASFVFYNFTGAAIWVGVCFGAGMLFGNIPIVKENFSLVSLGIIFASVLPIVIEVIRHRRSTPSAPAES
jgi:membrane-associated protein